MSPLPPLFGLICDCGHSLPLFRRFLQSKTQADYMNIPVYRGNNATKVASMLEDPTLSRYLSSHHTFVIVVSNLPNGLRWIDINNAKLPQQLEAGALVEENLALWYSE